MMRLSVTLAREPYRGIEEPANLFIVVGREVQSVNLENYEVLEALAACVSVGVRSYSLKVGKNVI